MKIAMIGHKYIPSRIGGVEVVVQELSTRMVERGYSVTCLNRSSRRNGYTGKEYRGVTLKNIPTVSFRGFEAMISSLIGGIAAAAGDYSVVHFHAEGACGFLPIVKVMGKRCIVTVHGLDYQRARWGFFASMYIHHCEKVLAKHADEVIVLSKELQKYFLENYNRETHLVPNGVTRPVYSSPDQIGSRFQLKKDGYILYLGRVVPEKDISLLIRSYRECHTDKKLLIAGSNLDDPAYFRRIQKMAAEDSRILLTGFASGQIFGELMSNAYVYVLPSQIEGMSLSLMEALSYGNCCLVSDIHENQCLLQTHGVTFRKKDKDDLRDKLQFLIDHPEAVDSMRENAASDICGTYDWDSVVEKTLEIYRGER